MKTAIGILAGCALALGASWAAAQTPSQSSDNQATYTICTLLVGSPNVNTEPHALMMTLSRVHEQELNAAEAVEDLAGLVDKLQNTFRLPLVDVSGSFGDWLSPGRQMVIDAPAQNAKLVVTSSGGSKYQARYHLKLTAGTTVVIDRDWFLPRGERTVLARQAEPNGPIYFVVVAVPASGAQSMKTTWGLELNSKSEDHKGMMGAARMPKKTHSVEPVLPPNARAAGLKGPVILTGTIGSDGYVTKIKVLKSVEGLDELAVAAFKQWRYEPVLDDQGKPIPMQTTAVFFKDEPDPQ